MLDPADGAGVLPLLPHAATRIDAAATSTPIRASLVFKMLLLHIRPVGRADRASPRTAIGSAHGVNRWFVRR
jgi:hypothetical protein